LRKVYKKLLALFGSLGCLLSASLICFHLVTNHFFISKILLTVNFLKIIFFGSGVISFMFLFYNLLNYLMCNK